MAIGMLIAHQWEWSGERVAGHSVDSSHLAHILAMAPMLLPDEGGGFTLKYPAQITAICPRDWWDRSHRCCVSLLPKIPIPMRGICWILNRKFEWKKKSSCHLSMKVMFSLSLHWVHGHGRILLTVSFLPPYPLPSPISLASFGRTWRDPSLILSLG